MIKNTTHSSIGCNGMANNDDYHGLEMYKNHAKDSTTEGCMQHRTSSRPRRLSPRPLRATQYRIALSRLARAVLAGFKVGASVRLMACPDVVEMGVELGHW